MELRFSQRMNFEPIEQRIQVDSINQVLKDRLWNAYQNTIGIRLKAGGHLGIRFYTHTWDKFFKKNLDAIRSNETSKGSVAVNSYFFSATPWYAPFEIMQFCIDFLKSESYSGLDLIYLEINKVLKEELSNYRIIDGYFVPISNEEEVSSITTAISNSKKFSSLEGCNIHLTEALNKLSDKENPDYRNSIKESISAIESLVNKLNDTSRGTLGDALTKVKNKIPIHPSLTEGFKKIYGYTSDAGGIRHAIMDEPDCDFDDAKFMLVSCSAFINYLVGKAEKTGLLTVGK